MKRIIIALISFVLYSAVKADDSFDKNQDVLVRDLYERATVVMRVWVKSEGVGSKYLWADVLNHATLKSPEGLKVPAELKVAYKSTGQGLPTGFATLYLELYNPDKPEFGLKLVEQYDSKTKELNKGYSHHSLEPKAEQGSAHQSTTRSESKSE